LPLNRLRDGNRLIAGVEKILRFGQCGFLRLARHRLPLDDWLTRTSLAEKARPPFEVNPAQIRPSLQRSCRNQTRAA